MMASSAPDRLASLNPPAGMSFTSSIWSSHAKEIAVATQHPFLEAAGRLELTRDQLSEYLTQDKVYAFQGYPRFASLMISHLPLSSPSSRPLLSLLSFALSNVSRESGFFDNLASKFELDLTLSPPTSAGGPVCGVLNRITKAYVDLLVATGAGGDLTEGLVLLWAMEKLYLNAWQHAKSFLPSSSDQRPATAQVAEPLLQLIDNWTCNEFVRFVEDCEAAVDALDLKEGSAEWQKAEEIFKYVVWLEQRFWPTI